MCALTNKQMNICFFDKKKNRKSALKWYDYSGENQTPLQWNGMATIPKRNNFDL